MQGQTSYYSVDNANNTETTHVSAQFRIDTVVPSTTSNVTPGHTYTGAQRFTLSPTDTNGSGVTGTWWQLDSTSGSWTSGTSVAVAAPSSGTVSHTLYFYSRDAAGNEEAPHGQVQFSVSAAPSTPMPVWRFYNFRAGTHFYTADPTEKERVMATMSSTSLARGSLGDAKYVALCAVWALKAALGANA